MGGPGVGGDNIVALRPKAGTKKAMAGYTITADAADADNVCETAAAIARVLSEVFNELTRVVDAGAKSSSSQLETEASPERMRDIFSPPSAASQ